MPVKTVKTLVIALFSLVIVALFGCGLSDPCSRKEVSRVTSPDGKVDSVVIKIDCGATTSESYNVFIVGNGMAVKESDLVFQADHMEDISISWREPPLLIVKYTKARIFQFRNFWSSKDVDDFNHVVEIHEIPDTFVRSLK